MKSDYAKGITAGLNLVKKHPSYRRYPIHLEHEIRAEIRKLEDKYRETIGDLVCPTTGEPAYMRISWYADAIRDAIRYGHGARFVIVRYAGHAGYTVNSLAEETVYDNPALAWQRSWELDPHGHQFKSIDMLYVNGCAAKFGLEEFYGLVDGAKS